VIVSIFLVWHSSLAGIIILHRRSDMNWKPALFALPLTAALVACPETKPTPTADFTIASAAPASLTFTKLASGDPAAQTVTVTITPANGFADAVTLSLVAPAGSSGVTGTGTITASATSGALTVNATNAATIGDNQQYTVQATSGSLTKTLALPISIKAVATAPKTIEVLGSETASGAVASDAKPSLTPFPSKGTPNQTLLRVGNRQNDAIVRGFLTFDLPPSVTTNNIVSAKLLMYQENFDPTSCDPFSRLTASADKLFVESVDFGSSLVGAAFDTATLSKLGNLSTSTAIELKTLDVSIAVKADLKRGTRSQFRLRFPDGFESKTDPTGCSARFTSPTGAPAANQPKLVITYTP
jgi:hypothetical protein